MSIYGIHENINIEDVEIVLSRDKHKNDEFTSYRIIFSYQESLNDVSLEVSYDQIKGIIAQFEQFITN